MTTRQYDTQAEFDAEQAAYADMDKTAAIFGAVNPVPATPAATWDRRLIGDSLRLARLTTTAQYRKYLIDAGTPGAEDMDDLTVRACVMGHMQQAITSLARGYEREITRNA